MRTALVVVDMLNDVVDRVLGNPAAKEVIGPIASLAEQARVIEDSRVAYANDAHQLSDVELRVFPPHAMAGTPGGPVIDELRPEPGDLVIEKRFYCAFTDTDLESVLRSHNVGRLVVVGQHTDCCVRHTCYGAFIRAYELVVCRDATTVFEPGDDEPLLARQRRPLSYLRTDYGARLEPASSVG
jgi:nicotinamidase-related amidase